jgi:hypothetical protein
VQPANGGFEVGDAVAVGGDAVGDGEPGQVGLDGSADKFGGIAGAEPGRQLLGRCGRGVGSVFGEIADTQRDSACGSFLAIF